MEKDNTIQPTHAKAIRVGRIEVGFNIILQLVLVVAGIAMLNWAANKYYARWDWSRGKNLVLSPQTKKLLGGLEKPVQAIVMFASTGEVEADALNLLREYQFASKGKLTVEEVDPFANLSRAKELQAQFKFGANENVVIFVYDGRHKFVNSSDLAEYEQQDQMAMMMRRPPQVLGFKGEQAFTSVLKLDTAPGRFSRQSTENALTKSWVGQRKQVLHAPSLGRFGARVAADFKVT